jgi:hypothetical protein
LPSVGCLPSAVYRELGKESSLLSASQKKLGNAVKLGNENGLPCAGKKKLGDYTELGKVQYRIKKTQQRPDQVAPHRPGDGSVTMGLSLPSSPKRNLGKHLAFTFLKCGKSGLTSRRHVAPFCRVKLSSIQWKINYVISFQCTGMCSDGMDVYIDAICVKFYAICILFLKQNLKRITLRG